MNAKLSLDATEAGMVSRIFGSPWDQLKDMLERKASAEKRHKKRRPASATGESNAPERGSTKENLS